MPSGKLFRSSTNKILGGVCGGIAEWLGWNPTAVRVLYVVISILSVAFPGILVYLVLWLVMPNAPTAAAAAEPARTRAGWRSWARGWWIRECFRHSASTLIASRPAPDSKFRAAISCRPEANRSIRSRRTDRPAAI